MYPVGTINTNATGYLISSTTTDAAGTNVNVVPIGTRIYNIHLISSGTASVLTIANGNGGTTYIKVTGTVSTGATFDFGHHGVTFPAGAYITVDGNIVSTSIACAQEQF
jgi:hypothetical protein